MIIQQPPIGGTSYELPVVSLPDPGIRPPKSSPPNYDYADFEREINMSIIDAEYQT